MLEFHEVSLKAAAAGSDAPALIHDLSAQIPDGHFCGIIGPPRSGKSALLAAVASLGKVSAGSIVWNGGNLEPRHAGYLCRSGHADARLTVRQNLAASVAVRASEFDWQGRSGRIASILADCGLADAASMGVGRAEEEIRRRLAVAMEMAGSPPILVCDDLAARLDPLGESAILKQLKFLAAERHQLVLVSTESVRHLRSFDSALVLYGGMLAYHGPAEFLRHYFHLEQTEDLFPTLARREPSDWYRSWLKHRAPYRDKVTGAVVRTREVNTRIAELFSNFRVPGSLQHEPGLLAKIAPLPSRPPGFGGQTLGLLANRALAFLRSPAEIAALVAKAVAAPGLLAWWIGQCGGSAAQLIAGLLLFLGAWNGAGELTRRRRCLEADQRAGVSNEAVLLSTAIFLALITLIEAFCAAELLRGVGLLNPQFGMHVALFAATIFAMTALSVAISSFARSTERAALMAVYLIVLQVLASFFAGKMLLGSLVGSTPLGAFVAGFSLLADSDDWTRLVPSFARLALNGGIGFALAWLGLSERQPHACDHD